MTLELSKHEQPRAGGGGQLDKPSLRPRRSSHQPDISSSRCSTKATYQSQTLQTAIVPSLNVRMVEECRTLKTKLQRVSFHSERGNAVTGMLDSKVYLTHDKSHEYAFGSREQELSAHFATYPPDFRKSENARPSKRSALPLLLPLQQLMTY